MSEREPVKSWMAPGPSPISRMQVAVVRADDYEELHCEATYLSEQLAACGKRLHEVSNERDRLASKPPADEGVAYAQAAIEYAEAWAAAVTADSITPRDAAAQAERKRTSDAEYEAGVRFMQARAANRATGETR